MLRLQKTLTLFIGIGAVIGAAMMWIDPTGRMWGMEPLLVMLRDKMPWPEVFFRDFIPSGIVLLVLNGLTQFAASCLLFKKHPIAPYTVLVCGIVLMLWIALEWWVWGFNAMSNIFFVLGLAEVAASIISIKQQHTQIEMKDTIAICGLDCEQCDAYIATLNNDQALREKTAKLWSEFNNVPILPEHINCQGCRRRFAGGKDGIKTIYCSSLCAIRRCALEKGMTTCGSCPEMEHCPTVGELHAHRPEARKNLSEAK